MVVGLVASVKSQILSHWSLTASGVMGLLFCLTIWPSERSQRTAHMDTQIKRSLHGTTHTVLVNQSRRNNAKATPQEIWTVLTFTDPACTNLNTDTRGWVNIQMGNSKIHSCRGKRHAAADSTMVAWICYTSKSPPFSWHCSWQSQRTKGATYSGFREATRSECNTGRNNRARYFYKREQCMCRSCRSLVACCLAILHWC